MHSLASDAAERKTFELVAEYGPAQDDFDPLFAALEADVWGALDAILDNPNMPLESEPARVQKDLQRFSVRGGLIIFEPELKA